MKKMREERPSNPQQSHLGVESNASGALDVAAATGGVGMAVAGRMMSGWVFVIFPAGFDGPTGFGKLVMRAVSFFGAGRTEASPKFSGAASSVALESGSGAAGFGSGFNVGDGLEEGGWTGGRGNGITGDSAAGSTPTGVAG
jgi:hypothetical protein